jgi:hypothetical protein
MSTTSLTKTASRWDCLANNNSDKPPRGHNRQAQRRVVKMVEPEKWVSDKSHNYKPKPDMENKELFPTLSVVNTAEAEAEAVMDFSGLEYESDDAAPIIIPEEDTMINVREYLKSRKQATDEDEPDPYLHYNMFVTIEDMKGRWYWHDFLNGTFVDYDCCIPDEYGLDTWDTDSESEGSDSDYGEEY